MGKTSLIYSTAEKRETPGGDKFLSWHQCWGAPVIELFLLSQAVPHRDTLAVITSWVLHGGAQTVLWTLGGAWCISLHASNINIKELVEGRYPHPILQTLRSSMFLRLGSPRSYYLEEPLVPTSAPTNKLQAYAGRPIGNQRWRPLIRAPL